MRTGGCLLALLALLILQGAGGSPLASSVALSEQDPAPVERGPSAWGSDHVGKPLPSYTTGEECLFCHRFDVGPTWSSNRHQRALRAAEAESPSIQAAGKREELAPVVGEVTVILGEHHAVRFLKPNGSYGQFALLSAAWIPPHDPAATPEGEPGGSFRGLDEPQWDNGKFGDACAGCHATAVAQETRAFSSPSLDCYTCHGVASPEHTKDSSLMVFSKQRLDSAQEVTSTCGQCHIRSGKSRSTGLPYPNQFVAGDNLFRDFEVDFSDAALARLNPADRHVLENVRDVVLYGDEALTCLTCHDVHEGSSKKHRAMRSRPSCTTCHFEEGPMSVVRPYEVHSEVCEY